MQELENKKAALELLQNETNDKLNDYKQQISILQKQIDDYNKPALTPKQLDDIHMAIEDAVDGYNFNDTENYEFEFGMEYDGRIYVESVSIQSCYEVTNFITKNIDQRFNVLPKNTEENTVTEVQKVI